MRQPDEQEDDLLDVALVLARMLTDSGERYSLDQILERFGYTREQLRQHPTYEE